MFDDLALLELQSKFDNKTEIISLPESAQYNAEQVGKGKVLGSDSKSKNLVYLDVSVLTLAGKTLKLQSKKKILQQLYCLN